LFNFCDSSNYDRRKRICQSSKAPASSASPAARPSVINASAYGVIKTALDAPDITKVYGAFHGIKGVLNDSSMIMDEEDPRSWRCLPYTPSSALGSCRYKIADPDEGRHRLQAHP
jgi:6-phosphofructokinase